MTDGDSPLASDWVRRDGKSKCMRERRFARSTIRGMVVLERPVGDFARINQMLLGGEESIQEISDSPTIRRSPRRAPRIQIVLFVEVFLNCSLRTFHCPK